MSSYTISQNKNTNTLAGAFASFAKSSAEESLKTGVTWNGDVNYSSLGDDFESKFLGFDQKMVTPQSCLKAAALDDDTRVLFDAHFNELMDFVRSKSDQERAKAFGLVFRYLFYVRSVRVAGKKSRLLFYYLFERLFTVFPKTCCALLSLVPDYGYFGDLDHLITQMSGIDVVVKAAEEVYLNHLNTDCQLIWGKPLNGVTKDEATSLNEKLKTMTTEEVRAFIGAKRLSLAAKWFKREGKKNSGHRKEILVSVYFPNGGITDLEASKDPMARALAKKRLSYCQMVFRHVISALSQCLLVGETMMCEEDPEHRTWASIPLAVAPAKFMTKYRKALANEQLKVVPEEHQLETGNRFIDREDRVQCRKNLLKTLVEGKLKGAAQDIDRLSSVVFENITHNHYGYNGARMSLSKTLSPTERLVIATQWKDLISKVKEEVIKAIETARAEAVESGEVWLDPRQVIPVVDTSGSMESARVQDKAIGLGILAAHLSTMPGCLISFSDKPEVFNLDMSGKADVFDHFLTIMNGPTGLNTNIDATYRVLLDLMVKSGIKETDFALLFLSDGQFDAQVTLPEESSSSLAYRGYGYYNREPASSRFQKTFLDRIEAAFKVKGYNLPRTVFWNLNCTSPGFPATSISRGVQLVSGYSQSLMLQVFTGDYKYEVQEDGTAKVSVNPWESFLKALLHQGYDQVSQVVASVGEGCLKHLAKSD